ncbi:hypothetical protein BKA70DRAFT_1568248 [Coprinopsis sp. MPI-PUGE-AT-0042]|nr:hypothetical protein BKA70DRAFT_1568248 [Coprinopsis sp. MPI-PUGE-AT-0042]
MATQRLGTNVSEGKQRMKTRLVQLPGVPKAVKNRSSRRQTRIIIDKPDDGVESDAFNPFLQLDSEPEPIVDSDPTGIDTSRPLDQSVDSKHSFVVVQYPPPVTGIAPPDVSPRVNQDNDGLGGSPKADSESNAQNVSGDRAKQKRGILGFVRRWRAKVKTPEVSSPPLPAPSPTSSHPPGPGSPRLDLPFFVFDWETSQSSTQGLLPSSIMPKGAEPCVHPGLLEAAMASNLLFTSHTLSELSGSLSEDDRVREDGGAVKTKPVVRREPVAVVLDEVYPGEWGR